MHHDGRRGDRRCLHPSDHEFGGPRRSKGGFGGRHRGRHGEREGHGHHGRHHRGRRGVLESGELRLVLLKLIAEQPRHGYDLIRAIEESSGGAYAPSPGVVYPALSVMEDMGLIAPSAAEGARKAFSATDEGSALLAENADQMAALAARLAALAEERERVDAGPIRRAMDNLRNVLRSRLGAEDAGKETIHDVAAILDEAAQRIERL